MKKITLFISALTILTSGAFSQSTKGIQQNTNVKTQRCHSDEIMKALRDLDPVTYDIRETQNEQQLQNWIANNYDANAKKAVITIPVVVQLWKTTGQVPDIRVTQQIDRLNADFRRTNTDAGNTPSTFSAVDCEIQFCLADVDPQGNSTTGIIRRPTTSTPPQSGGTDMWDPTKYLNLYVYDIGGGTLGFAYLSSQSPNQAVHITSSAFGNTSGPYNIGRTATHEVGHYFNIRHISGDANCGNDLVSDTPRQQAQNFGCKTHPYKLGTCSGNTTGEMYMNYMDYVDDNCMNAFTAGQKARMIAAINNNRSGLLTSSASKCSLSTGEKELVGGINKVSIFPNPSVGTISIALTKKVKTTVSVFNILGAQVFSSTENTQLFTVDMNDQSNGVYFVKIKSGDSVTTKKVILSK